MRPGLRTVRVTTRAAWRAWLEAHHASEREAWLVFHKVHTGARTVAYEDAVEEAIAFGWVDSLIKRLDDETYARKFTPRTVGSGWSEVNRRRLAKVLREGGMTEAGLAVADPEVVALGGAVAPVASGRRAEPVLAPELRCELDRNARARAGFEALTPSHRRNFVGWIMDAKRDETRRRRLAEAIALLAQGKKLGMK